MFHKHPFILVVSIKRELVLYPFIIKAAFCGIVEYQGGGKDKSIHYSAISRYKVQHTANIAR